MMPCTSRSLIFTTLLLCLFSNQWFISHGASSVPVDIHLRDSVGGTTPCFSAGEQIYAECLSDISGLLVMHFGLQWRHSYSDRVQDVVLCRQQAENSFQSADCQQAFSSERLRYEAEVNRDWLISDGSLSCAVQLNNYSILPSPHLQIKIRDEVVCTGTESEEFAEAKVSPPPYSSPLLLQQNAITAFCAVVLTLGIMSVVVGMFAGRTYGIRRKPSPPLYRTMSYITKSTKRTTEEDAVTRFFAMLSILVPFKGRPMDDISETVWQIKIAQPLQTAFFKIFQAVLAYPASRPLTELVHFTCHDVLHEELEKLRMSLGLQAVSMSGSTAVDDEYKKKAKEARMKIHEDTLYRFYSMLEIYCPNKLRYKVWDEQTIKEEQWLVEIEAPIRDAFHMLVEIMRSYPTRTIRQKRIVAYTLDTVLPHCTTGLEFRRIRYALTRPRQAISPTQSSVWDETEDNLKLAEIYQREALSLPSTSPEAVQAMAKYTRMTHSAKERWSTAAELPYDNKNSLAWTQSAPHQKLNEKLERLRSAGTAKSSARTARASTAAKSAGTRSGKVKIEEMNTSCDSLSLSTASSNEQLSVASFVSFRQLDGSHSAFSLAKSNTRSNGRLRAKTAGTGRRRQEIQ